MASPSPSRDPCAPAAPSFLEALLSPSPAGGLNGDVPSKEPRARLRSIITVPEGSTAGLDGNGWVLVGKDGKPVRPRPPLRSDGRSHGGDNKFKDLLLKKARGCCFKCLLPGHRISDCRNKARCLLCGAPGHKARWCKGVQEEGDEQRPPPTKPPGPSALRFPSSASANGFDDMEAPGLRRQGFAAAVAPRLAVVADTEKELSLHAVVAVVVGYFPQVELAEVRRAFAQRFGIEEGGNGVHVSLFGVGEYLPFFSDPAVRFVALATPGTIELGCVSFKLAPWTRFRSASAAQLCFKARVCLEGVPRSAWHIEAVDKLFDRGMLVDSQDFTSDTPEETACMRLWVWMANVDKLATRGVLKLEEPMGTVADPASRSGPLKLLDYKVLIHLDRVIDYSAQPNSNGPPEWRYRWSLELEEGTFPPPLPLAHSRSWFSGGQNGGGGSAAGCPVGSSEQQRGRNAGGRPGRSSDGVRPPPSSSSSGGGGAGVSSSGDGFRAREAAPGPQSTSPVQAVPVGEVLPLSRQSGSQSTLPEAERAPLLSEDEDSDDFLLLASMVGKQSRVTRMGKGGLPMQQDPSTEAPVPVLALERVPETQAPVQAPLIGGELEDLAPTVGPLVGPYGAAFSLMDQHLSPLGLASVPERVGLVSGPLPGLVVDVSSSAGELDEVSANGESFLSSVFSHIPPPLLQAPSSGRALGMPGFAASQAGQPSLSSPPSPSPSSPPRPSSGSELARTSGRLAAKPTSSLTTLEKARLVLLKKSGAVLQDDPMSKDDLKKYRLMYKKPIPAPFVKAVEELVMVSKPRRGDSSQLTVGQHVNAA
ncbi:hypothetical protein QYE76_011755 [Lolium multiflorum]|uniref:CCHC-type domain-containing protein n=1 Tax=Lolium multiflorum TaxID=4521 RepID=A0AAD8X314_LOLMU|nr:hypothetical protein QYE76_011755 [Lolium multiflorum]